MAVNRETMRLAAAARAEVNGAVNGTVRSLTSAWVAAWDDLAREWQAALSELAAGDEWPSRAALARADRAQRALDATREALDDLARTTGTQVATPLPDLTTAAAEWEARMTAAQMPAAAGAATELTARFNRVDPDQLAAIVNRSTQQITALTYPISTEATAVIQTTLIRGIALGDNPRATAREMLRRVEGGFNGGLTRALNIARTEQLDAHRAAGRAQDEANANVLTEWEWHTQLDVRTCSSCLVQHGTRHPLDEDGPLDHQQGRCARVPVTMSWRELGFNIDEPPSVTPDAKAWFDGLGASQQEQILGSAKLELYQSGRVSWQDLSSRRSTPGWRDSYAPTSLRALQARAA